MRRQALGTAVGICVGFAVVLPGSAGAASENFVPAFSFWSGAPIEEQKSAVAPSTDVPRTRVPTPAFPGAASAAPTNPPGAIVLRANPSGASVLRANPSGANAANPSGANAANPSGANAANPSGAPTDPRPKDETERWVPAFAFTSGALIQDVFGSVVGSDVTAFECEAVPGWNFRGIPSGGTRGCRGINQPRGFVSPVVEAPGKTSRFTSPYMGASLELSTPGLSFVPTRPRLFAHIDGNVDFAFDRSTARTGKPVSMEAANSPPVPPQIQNPNFPGVAIRGQGTKVDGEVESWLFGGGIGAAFTLEVFERRLRIKPSIEYLRESVIATGTAHRALLADPGSQGAGDQNDGERWNPNPRDSRFVFIELQAQKKKSFDMLGPGLELEMDTLRLGPTMVSLFVNAKAYTILGGRDIKFSDSQEIDDPFAVCPVDGGSLQCFRQWKQCGTPGAPGCVTPTEGIEGPYGYPAIHPQAPAKADFKLVMPEWSYNLGLGLRFRWLPEAGWR